MRPGGSLRESEAGDLARMGAGLPESVGAPTSGACHTYAPGGHSRAMPRLTLRAGQASRPTNISCPEHVPGPAAQWPRVHPSRAPRGDCPAESRCAIHRAQALTGWADLKRGAAPASPSCWRSSHSSGSQWRGSHLVRPGGALKIQLPGFAQLGHGLVGSAGPAGDLQFQAPRHSRSSRLSAAAKAGVASPTAALLAGPGIMSPRGWREWRT